MSALSHQKGRNRANANQSEMAAHFDSKEWVKKMSAMIVREIRDRLDWFGVDWAQDQEKRKEVRFLDYACGTGLISRVRNPQSSRCIPGTLTRFS